ncbi:hypothetical protein CK203_106398 [Vitis vinifera]|uniref:Uncharacterized protein n=1 Tax=Vitis vinifera TaxID=29760 RepID=A0A438CYW7_VITVI|nr:hypothetical protein CK203_106398 [Vitis vinifera]
MGGGGFNDYGLALELYVARGSAMVSSKQNEEVQHSNTRNNSRPVNQDGAWCTILVMHLRNHITMQHQENPDATTPLVSTDSGPVVVPPFQVYSGRTLLVLEPMQVQETKPQMGIESSFSNSSPLVDDLDQPIALGKELEGVLDILCLTLCPLEICLQNIEPS